MRPATTVESIAAQAKADGKKPRRYHLSALRGRALPNMLRQKFCGLRTVPACLVATFFPVVFMGALIIFDKAIVSSTAIQNQELIETVIAAAKTGCGNSTEILTKMCDAKANTASTDTYTGCKWCPEELGMICNFWSDAGGDQCASSYGTGSGQRWNPAFQTNCTVGPNERYKYEQLTPAFCNCSSPEFTQLTERTFWCDLDSTFSSLFLQDPDSNTVVRNFNASRDGQAFDYGFWSGFFPDNWANYVSWRIPIIAPAELQVGELSGYLRDNGWLGSWNQSYDASTSTRVSVDSATSVTGLLKHFPSGIAYTDPGSLSSFAAYDPDTFTGIHWQGRESCMADGRMTTCCFFVTREIDNPFPQCPNGKIGCEEEADEEVALTKCRPCTEYESNPFKASNLWLEEREYSEGQGMSVTTVTRNLTFNVDSETRQSYCHGRQCMASRCEADSTSNGWKNPKCGSVVSSMQDTCTNYTEQILAACTAGEQWVHPADPTLLMYKWATWIGTPVFAPYADVSVSAELKKAFDSAWAAGIAASTAAVPTQHYVPSANCIKPFCYDFRSAAPSPSEPLNWMTTSGYCSATNSNFTSLIEPLYNMYPCNGHKADAYTEGDVLHNSSSAFSTAEAQLCKEAYGSATAATNKCPAAGTAALALTPFFPPFALASYC